MPETYDSSNKRNIPSLPAHLQLLNRYSALRIGEDKAFLSEEALRPVEPEPTARTKNKWWVIEEISFCRGWRNPSACLCSFLGRSATCTRLGSQILWRDCWCSSCPQTATSGCPPKGELTVLPRETWNKSKSDYRPLGKVKKGLGGHVVFSSVFSVKVKGLGRFGHIMQVNAWVSGWYCRQIFSF